LSSELFILISTFYIYDLLVCPAGDGSSVSLFVYLSGTLVDCPNCWTDYAEFWNM